MSVLDLAGKGGVVANECDYSDNISPITSYPLKI